MGACDFTATSKLPNVSDAYNECVQLALHEYGHDGYNGTISTTNGYKVFSAKPVTQVEAEAIVEREMDNLSKWDACGAVAVSDAGDGPTRKVTRKVTLDNESADYELRQWADSPEGQAKLKLALKPGERLLRLTIIADERTYTHKKVRNYGAVERRFIAGMNRRITYPTFAEAEDAWINSLERAATAQAEHRAKYPGYGGSNHIAGEHTITEIVLRGGEAWRTKIVTTVKRKLTVELELVGPASPSSTFHHWLFFGWAAT